MTLPLAIWTTGEPVPMAARAQGSFFDMIQRGLRRGFLGEILDINSQLVDAYPSPDEVAGIVVSGSPARLGDAEPWMLRTEEALRQAHAAGTPILGICFGHQLLGEALGGRVAPNPRGREIGTPTLNFRAPDVFLDGVPEEPCVVMTHLDSVVVLPSGATVLRSTPLEPNAAIRFSETTWGVQFHPEMNAETVGYYLEARRLDIAAEGHDVDALLAARRTSSFGTRLLERFARYCRDGQFRAS